MQADFDGLRGTIFVIYTGINSSLWPYAYIVENPPLLIKRQVPSSALTSRSHCGNGVSDTPHRCDVAQIVFLLKE
jgi:hypothetical protein